LSESRLDTDYADLKLKGPAAVACLQAATAVNPPRLLNSFLLNDRIEKTTCCCQLIAVNSRWSFTLHPLIQ
jgi:hypothetical protein